VLRAIRMSRFGVSVILNNSISLWYYSGGWREG
jgi:hypothetical protein